MSATFAAVDVEVGTSDAVVASYEGVPFELMNVQISNTGDTPLNRFHIEVKDHPAGEWYTYFGRVTFHLIGTTPVEKLPAGQTAHFSIDIGAAFAFRFLAAVASGSTTVTLLGHGKRGD